MRATQPSERHARAALLGAFACVPADVIFVVFLVYQLRGEPMPEPGTEGFWALASLALALFSAAAIGRVATPLTYLLWLHRAYANALTLAAASERGTTTARAVVVWTTAPLVQIATGLVAARRLDAMSQAHAGSPAWWIGPWWIAAMAAVWSEIAFVVLAALAGNEAAALLGSLLLISIGTRWIAMPATALFIRRIERLQRERAERRDWADVF